MIPVPFPVPLRQPSSVLRFRVKVRERGDMDVARNTLSAPTADPRAIEDQKPPGRSER